MGNNLFELGGNCIVQQSKCYKLTKKQQDKLRRVLKENILERYNNSEYWDQEIIDEFLREEFNGK